jgi:OmpA-OmpF porin, OOP family
LTSHQRDPEDALNPGALFSSTAKERTMRIKNVAVLLAASALSIPAYAADSGWFLFGSAGMTKYKDKDPTPPGISVDDSDIGFKLGGGYMFNKYLGFEAAYVDLGKEKFTAPGFSADATASGEVVSALGVWPINEQFSLLGRVGAINATVKVSGGGQSVKSTDVKLTYGVGGAFNLNKQFSVRLEWDRYDKLGNSDPNSTGESDVDLISLGVVYKF